MQLALAIKGVSVDLNISVSLLVINTLAVKRAELRGGLLEYRRQKSRETADGDIVQTFWSQRYKLCEQI